jgi:hypothetical protein
MHEALRLTAQAIEEGWSFDKIDEVVYPKVRDALDRMNSMATYKPQIDAVIERHIQMERDAVCIDNIRAGRIRSIASLGNTGWRVDTDRHFYIRDTLDAAMSAALDEQMGAI